MITLDEIKAILDRIEDRTYSDADVVMLHRALADGDVTIATGQSSVAVGGAVTDSVMVTGDGNVVRIVRAPDASVIQQALRRTLNDMAADRFENALVDYLEAVRTYTNNLPYITLPGKRVPLLTVYIEQQAEQQGELSKQVVHDRQLDSVSPPRRGEAVEMMLNHHRHFLLEGGPGTGKSTLLNHLALALIEDWRRGEDIRMFPVRVFARGLAARRSSLNLSLRDQVTQELGLSGPELPSDFFARPPIEGGAWLVLVDGLDEVVAQTDLTSLVQGIVHHAGDSSVPYRFIVTSRPITAAEYFNASTFGRYSLRPFEPGQVRTFATKWFANPVCKFSPKG